MNRNKNRGYAFESDLTNHINEQPGWTAWRLGGTQIQLPDVMAVSRNRHMIIYELKSTVRSSGRLYVKPDQIKRCVDFGSAFLPSHAVSVVCGFRWRGKIDRYVRMPQGWLHGDDPETVWCAPDEARYGFVSWEGFAR